MRRNNSLLLIIATSVIIGGCAFINDIRHPPEKADLAHRTINEAIGKELDSHKAEETPVTFETKNVLPDNLIHGPHYTVAPEVQADGFMYYFQVNSDYGDFDAYGISELKERIDDLKEIKKLKEISTVSSVASNVWDSVTSPFVATWHLITHPISSVEAVPDTVSSLYEKASDTVSDVTDQGKEVYSDLTTSSQSDEERAKKQAALMDRARRFADQYSDDYISYSKSKRSYAAECGADPYSDNPLIQQELIRLARTSVATKVGMQFVPIPSVPGMSYAAKADNLIWSEDEKGVVEKSYKSLLQIGIPAETIEKLLANQSYTRSQIAVLTELVDEIKDIQGLSKLIAYAANASNHSHATITIESFILLHRYHTTDTKLKLLDDQYLVPSGITEGGALVFPAPFDYLMYTEPFMKFLADTSEQAGHDKSLKEVLLYTTAKFSPAALAEVNSYKWKIKQTAW